MNKMTRLLAVLAFLTGQAASAGAQTWSGDPVAPYQGQIKTERAAFWLAQNTASIPQNALLSARPNEAQVANLRMDPACYSFDDIIHTYVQGDRVTAYYFFSCTSDQGYGGKSDRPVVFTFPQIGISGSSLALNGRVVGSVACENGGTCFARFSYGYKVVARRSSSASGADSVSVRLFLVQN